MPQINRIRVNNVKYNFGTQYYDDFIMRFSGKNTIYDLANGGGKSLLMLLLLQNVIPNCTLDDKQPIEKLFRGNSGNTAIHSMIEWNLDPCYRRDNYKYMLTGFCARKARGTESDGQAELQSAADGMSEAQGDSGVQGGSGSRTTGRDSASIEYFNYVIFYREFGENDLRNLPLTTGNERITYQGLKNYLRDLEKRDFHVSVKIFERKGDYQNFISRYGLYESEWEIVRGINKTEGHVRTYFETNYRTSRKVVEDLLIEEIIQKSFHNRLGVENDEEQMAQTLIDIKDKLIELSRKHGEISSFDEQIAAIDEFAGNLAGFDSIYQNQTKLQMKLAAMLAQSTQKIEEENREITRLEELLANAEGALNRERKAIATAEILSQERSAKALKEAVAQTEQKKKAATEETKHLRRQLLEKECAGDYEDYLTYQKQLEEIRQVMDNRMRDHGDIVAELQELAAVRKERNTQQTEQLVKQLEQVQAKALEAQKEVNRLQAEEAASEKSIAIASGRMELLNREKNQTEHELKELLALGLVLVSENAQETSEAKQMELEQLQREEKTQSEELQQLMNRAEQCRHELSRAQAMADVLEETIEVLEAENQKNLQLEQKLEELSKVYAQTDIHSLNKAVYAAYKNLAAAIAALEDKIYKTTRYVENLCAGRFVCDGDQYARVQEYLTSVYGEDVCTGAEWFASLNPGQKRDINKRVPFIHYGFVIKNDFERVKADAGLQEIYGSSYVIPIISENVLYDMKLEVNTELVAFASKNLQFLSDHAQVEAEIAQCSEEIENWQIEIARLRDRAEVIHADYELTLAEEVRRRGEPERAAGRLAAKQAQLETVLHKKAACAEDSNTFAAHCVRLREALEQKAVQRQQLTQDLEHLQKMVQLDLTLQGIYKELEANEMVLQDGRTVLDRVQRERTPAVMKLEQEQNKAAALSKEKEQLELDWVQIYAAYYTEAAVNVREEICAMEDTALESRFIGLRTVIEKNTSDVRDKETLMEHLRNSMNKCRSQIAYRGMEFAEVAEGMENHTITAAQGNELLELKKRLQAFEQAVEVQEKELEAQCALLNRLEGSIEHGKNQIVDQFGSYDAFECSSPESFAAQHKTLLKQMHADLKQTENDNRAADRRRKDLQLMQKDLERIVRNCGITEAAMAQMQQGAEDVEAIPLTDYETVQRELELVLQQLAKRKEDFARRKKDLITRLNKIGAAELAEEFDRSLAAPENALANEELRNNLNETNEYIRIEKDRLGKSIADMEKIKDSFENRCIQTCSNIKTELDRLPKLSTITMEDEVISIIGLQIPYVKEELYKDRMSAYIDETVTGAESFQNAEGRLTYIKNRLSWKRLFSVIVTDMNAIRVNLYKRERIKDQSRYLKYEEAVGSTGQSQGIYIQFLIAVINYISNVNASGQEAASLAKTIFIDNPFGAAKDIYIWEPIFKMLKTNHVQLIVPARGATPAITGRFDVNYILGQKMVGTRQQTVVVDYHSQIEGDAMEYARLEYEQETLSLF